MTSFWKRSITVQLYFYKYLGNRYVAAALLVNWVGTVVVVAATVVVEEVVAVGVPSFVVTASRVVGEVVAVAVEAGTPGIGWSGIVVAVAVEAGMPGIGWSGW